MTLEDLIGLADVKEKQAFALLCYYNEKIPHDELQEKVDLYCDNLANTFVSDHRGDLSKKQIMLGMRKHILNIGADKKHSGHRFYESLYIKLNNFSKQKANQI